MATVRPHVHDCAFPDESCSTCERASEDLGPPCCHTPYLCGGPFDDCAKPPGGWNEAPRAQTEAIAAQRRVRPAEPCVCDTDFTCLAAEHIYGTPLDPKPAPLYSGPHGNGTIHPVVDCNACAADSGSRPAGQVVVHVTSSHRCCITDGCPHDCG